jgi:hypothetical protein
MIENIPDEILPTRDLSLQALLMTQIIKPVPSWGDIGYLSRLGQLPGPLLVVKTEPFKI